MSRRLVIGGCSEPGREALTTRETTVVALRAFEVAGNAQPQILRQLGDAVRQSQAEVFEVGRHGAAATSVFANAALGEISPFFNQVALDLIRADNLHGKIGAGPKRIWPPPVGRRQNEQHIRLSVLARPDLQPQRGHKLVGMETCLHWNYSIPHAGSGEMSFLGPPGACLTHNLADRVGTAEPPSCLPAAAVLSRTSSRAR